MVPKSHAYLKNPASYKAQNKKIVDFAYFQ